MIKCFMSSEHWSSSTREFWFCRWKMTHLATKLYLQCLSYILDNSKIWSYSLRNSFLPNFTLASNPSSFLHTIFDLIPTPLFSFQKGNLKIFPLLICLPSTFSSLNFLLYLLSFPPSFFPLSGPLLLFFRSLPSGTLPFIWKY